MKKFTSFILVLALLISLVSVTAFADGNSISISFSLPQAGDPIDSNTLKNCVSSSTHSISVSAVKLYDGEKLQEISNIGSLDEFNAYFGNESAVTSGTYASKKYVALFSIYIESPSPTASTNVIFENNLGATWNWNTLENSLLFCYFEFEPASGTSTPNTNTPASEGGSHAVYATYQKAEESDTVYSVDIDFGDMKFTYTAASKGTWDADEGEYVGATDAKWDSKTNNITVTNKSNAPITAEFQYESLSEFDDVQGTFLNADKTASVTNPVTLKSADDSSAEGTISATVYLDLTGDLPSTTLTETQCGTVTVVIDNPK